MTVPAVEVPAGRGVPRDHRESPSQRRGLAACAAGRRACRKRLYYSNAGHRAEGLLTQPLGFSRMEEVALAQAASATGGFRDEGHEVRSKSLGDALVDEASLCVECVLALVRLAARRR